MAKNIVEIGKNLGREVAKAGYMAGERYAIQYMVTPKFWISKTQHQKIMEVLGIQNYKTKKLFNAYVIVLDNNGHKNNGGE